ncbi:MAG: DNA adenine methylase [Candidatus Pacearchaeota archaeon]
MNTLLPFFVEGDNILKIKKEAFLKSILSKNKNSINKYKRVVTSPIRYAGGKSLAVGYIIELLPENTKRVVSPFFGGGSVEIAISKYLGLEVLGFDIFDILVNYWKYQIENPELLYFELRKLKPNEETFYEVRQVLKDHWEGKIKLDPLKLAAYFFFNFNLSYGPGFLGWASKVYLNEKRYQKMIEKVRDFNPGNLKVGCADFRETLEKYRNDFMYLDPPYYIGPDSKMFKGIYPQRNFPIHHKDFPHEVLRDMLKKHKGGFILSYTNCPTIREWYKDYQQIFPKWQYTMGQGETRIGKYRKERGMNSHVKESHEIIIYCPPKN